MSNKTYGFTDSSLPAKLLTANKVKLDFWNESLGINESILLEKKEITTDSVAFVDSDGVAQFSTYIRAILPSQSGGIRLQSVLIPNATIAIDEDFLPTSAQGSGNVHLNFRITCISSSVQKIDPVYYNSGDWNALVGEEGYIQNKPFGDEEYKMSWGTFSDVAFNGNEALLDIAAQSFNNFMRAIPPYAIESGELVEYMYMTIRITHENGEIEDVKLSYLFMDDSVAAFSNGDAEDLTFLILGIPFSHNDGDYVELNLSVGTYTGTAADVEARIAELGASTLEIIGVAIDTVPINEKYLPTSLQEMLEAFRGISLPYTITFDNNGVSEQVGDEIMQAVEDGGPILAVYNQRTYMLSDWSSTVDSTWTFYCGTTEFQPTLTETGDGSLRLQRVTK